MSVDRLTPNTAVSRPSELGLSQVISQTLLNWGLLIFLIVLLIIFSLLERRFATVTNLQNVIRQAAPLLHGWARDQPKPGPTCVPSLQTALPEWRKVG